MPVCTPHRASLLTGQRPLTHGLFMNDVQLDTNAYTIAEVLKARDTRLAISGNGIWMAGGEASSPLLAPEGRAFPIGRP